MGRRVVDAPRRDAYGRVRVRRARRTRPVARVYDARRGRNGGVWAGRGSEHATAREVGFAARPHLLEICAQFRCSYTRWRRQRATHQ